MAKPRKSWREKLDDDKGFPRVFPIDQSKNPRWGAGTCVIPAPREVDELMGRVKKGRVTTIDQLRAALAKRHGATIACPITTGIFAWIAAHAAVEAQDQGRKRITPYWRTLKSGGELNPKYPGGLASMKKKLVHEGHNVVRKGKRFFVAGFEDRLASIV